MDKRKGGLLSRLEREAFGRPRPVESVVADTKRDGKKLWGHLQEEAGRVGKNGVIHRQDQVVDRKGKPLGATAGLWVGSDEGPDGGKVSFQSVLDLQPASNLLAAVEDRGVVPAAEQAPDLGKGLAPIVAEQIHCNLTRSGRAGVATLPFQVLGRNLEMSRHSGKDLAGLGWSVRGGATEAVQRKRCSFGGQGQALQLRVNKGSCECPFQLADVPSDPISQKVNNFVRDVRATHTGMRFKERATKVHIGGLNVCDEPSFESTAQARS